MSISTDLLEYLAKWYKTSTGKKVEEGVTVALSFNQFIALFEKRQLASLQKAIDGNYLFRQQHQENPYAYVFTWRSYRACSSNILNAETACVCSRLTSKQICLPQAGDKLRPNHCANISQSLTGKEKTAEHADNISKGKKGRSISAWTPERREARSELRRAQEAAKKGKAA